MEKTWDTVVARRFFNIFQWKEGTFEIRIRIQNINPARLLVDRIVHTNSISLHLLATILSFLFNKNLTSRKVRIRHKNSWTQNCFRASCEQMRCICFKASYTEIILTTVEYLIWFHRFRRRWEKCIPISIDSSIDRYWRQNIRTRSKAIVIKIPQQRIRWQDFDW